MPRQIHTAAPSSKRWLFDSEVDWALATTAAHVALRAQRRLDARAIGADMLCFLFFGALLAPIALTLGALGLAWPICSSTWLALALCAGSGSKIAAYVGAPRALCSAGDAWMAALARAGAANPHHAAESLILRSLMDSANPEPVHDLLTRALELNDDFGADPLREECSKALAAAELARTVEGLAMLHGFGHSGKPKPTSKALALNLRLREHCGRIAGETDAIRCRPQEGKIEPLWKSLLPIEAALFEREQLQASLGKPEDVPKPRRL